MNLSEKYISMHENKTEIELEGRIYQLDVQKGIKALIQFEYDNPDMGNSDDFKDDAERLRRLTKQLKGLDVATVKEQIEIYVGDDQIDIKKLLKDKVIR